jgi:hypothetical protein
MAVSVFRFSAAQVRWSQAELDQLQSLWVQAYKRAEYLANGTATDVFIFPKKWGGEELSTPVNIIAQEPCNNIRRCLVQVVVTGPFINFLLHNHSVIYIIIIFFFRRSKRQRNFCLLFFAS